MKILLTAINAKYIHSNLAVYSLRAYARRDAQDIEIAEFTINNRKDDILEQIYKSRPDVLCFSCYIWNLDYVEEIAREFHKLCPQTPIWVGGPEVSYETEDFLKNHPEITGVMIGEGEETFRELCSYYASLSHGQQRSGEMETEDLQGVFGIAFRSGNRDIVRTGPREPVDMSAIPFCYDAAEDFSHRILYYESSRGCPFSCSYCLSSVDKQLRFRDLSLVKKELRFFLDQKVPQVKFVDRTFNCNHGHAMEIWRFIKEHDNGITNFHFEAAADLLSEEELALIADMRPGLIQLEIGVQSTNQVTISEIHRKMDLGRVKEAVRAIQAAGNIHIHLDLIAGLPCEDYETFGKSFDEIYAWKPDQLQLGFLKVLKGSYLHRHAGEYGMVYHSRPPYEVLSTDWLSYEELLGIKQAEEMLEVYYNSGQFAVTMKVMETLFDRPFQMYCRMGRFYEEKGYFGMSHSRIRRCEILLEFLENSKTKEAAIYNGYSESVIDCVREALTFDLYSRENCKSRPGWAPEESGWKGLSRQYCPRGKMSHLEPFHYRFPGRQTKTLSELPAYSPSPFWALFCYDERDPLDRQARVEWVNGEGN